MIVAPSQRNNAHIYRERAVQVSYMRSKVQTPERSCDSPEVALWRDIFGLEAG